jgi:hypothetical protein
VVPSAALDRRYAEERRIADDIISKCKISMPLAQAQRVNWTVTCGMVADAFGTKSAGTVATPPIGHGQEPMQISTMGAAKSVTPQNTAVPGAFNLDRRGRNSSPYSVVRANVNILDMDIVGIIDSGASNTVMSYATAQKLQLGRHIEEVDMPFWNADGHKSVPVGIVRNLRVCLGKATLPLDVFITKATNYDILLGNDFLGPLGANIDYNHGKLEYQIDPNTRGSVSISYGGPPAMDSEMAVRFFDSATSSSLDGYDDEHSFPVEPPGFPPASNKPTACYTPPFVGAPAPVSPVLFYPVYLVPAMLPPPFADIFNAGSSDLASSNEVFEPDNNGTNDCAVKSKDEACDGSECDLAKTPKTDIGDLVWSLYEWFCEETHRRCG